MAQIIAEVDCTAEETQHLCNRFDVQAYPTLKFVQAGDASMQAYEGENSYDALYAFATQSVKPACVPANRGACDQQQLEFIDSMLAMSAMERRAEYERLAGPLKEEEAKLATLNEKLEKLEDKVEEQEDLVDKLKASIGAKLRLVQSTLLEEDASPAHDEL